MRSNPQTSSQMLFKPKHLMMSGSEGHTKHGGTTAMKIHEVEELVGITKKNIRFYEHEGLLHPGRKENGYRDYSQQDVTELKKIKFLRSLSFPLEEIRHMQVGNLTISDGARRHLIVLEREQHSLEKAQLLCTELIRENESLQTLDVDAFLEKMKGMEKEGAVFMNVKKQDHRSRYIAPVIASATIILLMAIIIFLMLSESLAVHLSPGIILILGVGVISLLAVIIGVILALLQRIKQIKGGEEDAAAKY